LFCEASRELAAIAGLTHGGWATITTARGEIECRVPVTERLKPLRIRGRQIHPIGLPYHWPGRPRARRPHAPHPVPLVGDGERRRLLRAAAARAASAIASAPSARRQSCAPCTPSSARPPPRARASPARSAAASPAPSGTPPVPSPAARHPPAAPAPPSSRRARTSSPRRHTVPAAADPGQLRRQILDLQQGTSTPWHRT